MAGRIESNPTPIGLALDGWAEYLTTVRHRCPGSVRNMRGDVQRGIASEGWTDVAALTLQAVTGYIARASASRGWTTATKKRVLVSFRSLTRWAEDAGLIERDPLVRCHVGASDPAPGSRAATTDEARALMRVALVRGDDGRARGVRSLYWGCLFLCGCRYSEPATWRWRNLLLDERVILWEPDMHKGRRRQETPIAPELARMLARHRETVPNRPDDPVFPVVPSRVTFRLDADLASIQRVDTRGRAFSPHSCRKWFSTTLTGLGVPERLVDRLMRHAGRTEMRYYDPTAREMAEAVARLPRLWPDSGVWTGSSGLFSRFLLDSGRRVADAESVTLSATPTSPTHQTARRPRPCPVCCERHNFGISAAGPGPGVVVVDLPPWAAGVFETGSASRRGFQTGNGEYRPDTRSPTLTQPSARNTDLSDMLAALSRLVREDGHGRT